MQKPIRNEWFMRSARAKAAAYRKLRPGETDLADFAGLIDLVGTRYQRATRGAATMPNDVPYAVLRRWVYRLGHAYAEAGMQAELQAYVEHQYGASHRLANNDAFVWVIKLIRYTDTYEAVSSAEWSKMAPVLALAEGLDIHSSYLEHFITMCGGMSKIRMFLGPDKQVPKWVVGITRRAQRAVKADLEIKND